MYRIFQIGNTKILIGYNKRFRFLKLLATKISFKTKDTIICCDKEVKSSEEQQKLLYKRINYLLYLVMPPNGLNTNPARVNF